MIERPASHAPLLSVRNLQVSFPTRNGLVRAVRGVSFDVARGKALGLIGESGSGKSVTGLSLVGLQGSRAIISGSISFEGRNLPLGDKRALAGVRGRKIGFIFQNPLSALNPVRTVGAQFMELLGEFGIAGDRTDFTHARLREVGIAEPERVLAALPHELSGGLNQRVVIAMALAGDPPLLIADEPTTALDVVTQAQVMQLLETLRKQRDLSVLFISHNLALVASFCDRIAVAYAGRIVESGDVAEVTERPAHPYTLGLLRAVPRLGRSEGALPEPIPGEFFPATSQDTACSFRSRCTSGGSACEKRPKVSSDDIGRQAAFHYPIDAHTPIADRTAPKVYDRQDQPVVLTAKDISKSFRPRPLFSFGATKEFKAVEGVTLELRRGASVGIVGESGSGKSTLARILSGQIGDYDGEVRIGGELLDTRSLAGRRKLARRAQLVFQHPLQSLDPRLRIFDAVAEPLRFHGVSDRRQRRSLALGALDKVGLPETLAERQPNQLSGGQLQRVVLARALVMKPDILICDEPVSALDVSIQAQVLRLLDELRHADNLALVFISHDLSVVSQVCDEIGVMYRGNLVEFGSSEELFVSPKHPYTRQLVDAVPRFLNRHTCAIGQTPALLEPPDDEFASSPRRDGSFAVAQSEVDSARSSRAIAEG